MSKLTKSILGLVIIVLVVGGLWLSQKGGETRLANGPIKIGFISPLSGDGSAVGITEKNATQLAVDEINKAGGIKGHKLEIIYEDGKCDGKEAATAAAKLINIDQVKVVLGGTCSSETLAVAPIVEKAKVVLLSAFSSNPQITMAGDYVFRNSPSDSDVAKLDANTIVAKGYKRVAMISENSDYSQGVRKIMLQIFVDNGIQVVSDELFGGTNNQLSDFRTNLLKIKASNPDLLYVNPASSGKIGGLIVRQARQSGLAVPIYGNWSLLSPDAFTTAGKYIEGIVAADGTGLAQSGLAVLAKYKLSFGAEPNNAYDMGASYDRVYLIKNAIEAGGYNADHIRDYLYGMKNYNGAVGSYHFDQNGDVVGVGFTEYTIKDGQKVLFK